MSRPSVASHHVYTSFVSIFVFDSRIPKKDSPVGCRMYEGGMNYDLVNHPNILSLKSVLFGFL